MQTYGYHYDAYTGRYFLTKNGVIVGTRLRQFRKAYWTTEAGVKRAVATLNASINNALDTLAEATKPVDAVLS